MREAGVAIFIARGLRGFGVLRVRDWSAAAGISSKRVGGGGGAAGAEKSCRN
jgi:hypothetical protein